MGDMSRKKKTWFAILGLLSWKPMSGYDIHKLVEMGLSHFWNESYGQLFPTLNRLVEEGLATRRLDSGKSRRKKHIYRITAKGRREFRAWLAEPSDEPRVRNELQLKFFLTSRSDPVESLRLLEEYREQQTERLHDYRESAVVLESVLETQTVPDELKDVEQLLDWRQLGDGDKRDAEIRVFHLTLRHGILAIEARLAWIEEAIRSLNDGTENNGG
jgi:PadR family transcriptional regulator AphA